MRQASLEAATKAGAAKHFKQPSKISPETIQALDNSAPGPVAPLSGTTEAEEAIAPETGASEAVSNSDSIPASPEGSEEVQDLVGHAPATGAVTQHRGSNVSTATAEEIKVLEDESRIPEEEEEEGEEKGGQEVAGETTETAVEGEKTQEQPAASGEEAG